MSRVVQVRQLGGPEHLVIAETTPPEPGPGELRISVEAFALNRADLLYMNGQHYTELQLPSRLGSEAAGLVDSVGPGVTGWRVGDRVSSVPFFTSDSPRHGVQGEFALVPAAFVAPWPENFSAAEACATWMQYLTAYFALLDVGRLRAGQVLLVVAGASSAGLGAIQLAKAVGATVIATTRQASKVEALRQVGADQVIHTQGKAEFAAELRQLTDGAGVDVVYDPVGGSFPKAYMNGLARGARVIVYGLLDGDLDLQVPMLAAVRAMASVHPYSMFNHVTDPQALDQGVRFVLELIAAGRLRPQVDRVFEGIEQTVAAYQYMLEGAQQGKIVVRVSA